MHGENMAKKSPICCQIAKIFITITSGKNIIVALEKPGKLWELFFSCFVATLMYLIVIIIIQ